MIFLLAIEARSPKLALCWQVTLEVDDGDGSVGSVDRPQQGQRDGVVTAKCDHTGQGFTLDRRTPLVRIRCRGAREDVEVTFLNLSESEGVVVRRDRDVTAIEHCSPAVEGVGLEGNIVTSANTCVSHRI